MLLVKKNTLTFSYAVFVLFMLVLGISGYLLVNKIDLNDTVKLKFYSETVIFLMIIFILFSTAVYLIIYYKSVKVIKELDKTIEITKYGNYDVSKSLVKIGELGDRIKDLYYHLDLLNRQKSIKISSLSNIVNFLLNNTDLNILITDVEGLIVYSSSSFYEKFEIEMSLILYNNINIIKNIDYNDIIINLDKSRERIINEKTDIEIDKKNYNVNIMYIPVFNIQNQISNVISIFEKSNFLSITKLNEIK